MNIRRATAIGLLSALAFVGAGAAKCDVTVKNPPPAQGGGTTTTTETTTPAPTTTTTPVPEPVVIDGDAGLDAPFSVVAVADVNLTTEVQPGVYTTPGAIAGGECKFVQTRPVTITEPQVQVVETNDQAAADVVVPDEPVTEVPDTDLSVTLVAGDAFYTDGCQDWVLQEENN